MQKQKGFDTHNTLQNVTVQGEIDLYIYIMKHQTKPRAIITTNQQDTK